MAADIAKIYEVNLIPYTVLINNEGEIAGVNLHGQKLREKIKKSGVNYGLYHMSYQ
jgi:acyl-[acyl carrier protein]--UDP-N-acetylglucosamine O-acyltransferase